MDSLKLDYDVAIIGGGVAGVSAALASARSNKKTLIIESQFMIGGLATSGLVCYYLPIDDGEGHQICYGLCEELFRLSISKGNEGRYPEAWLNDGPIEEKIKQRFQVKFNPQLFSILCEKQLLDENVKILYGCIISKVEIEGNRIVKLIGHTRTHDVEIKANAFVDCTGDATICEKAGLKVENSLHGNVQANWYFNVKNGSYNLVPLGSCDYVYSENKSYSWFAGYMADELSNVMQSTHRNILEDFLKNGEGTSENAIATIPTIPQVRITRKLVGECSMNKKDNGLYIEHSVGLITSWLERGLNYELPAEALFNKQIQNLYVAGRCISVLDDAMWDITRSIPACVVSGEASGYLAANYYNNNNIDFVKTQSDLKNRNVKIHLDSIFK